MDKYFEDDDLGLDAETEGERIARENMEADLRLIAELRALRERRGLNQEQLGAMLGVSQAAVSAFESDANVKLSTVRKYAHALGGLVTHVVTPVNEDSIAWRWAPGVSTSTAQRMPITIDMGPSRAKRTDFAMAA